MNFSNIFMHFTDTFLLTIIITRYLVHCDVFDEHFVNEIVSDRVAHQRLIQRYKIK